MKNRKRLIMSLALLPLMFAVALTVPRARAGDNVQVARAAESTNGAPLYYQWDFGPVANTNVPEAFRSQFFRLCDMAAVKVRDEHNRVPFFVDSYAVRALCVAYDMTGNTNYLDACRDW